MYNIEKLEKKWMRYKRKKLIMPLFFSFFLLLFVGFGVFWVASADHVGDKTEPLGDILTKKSPAGKQEKRQLAKMQNLATEVPSLKTKKVNDEENLVGKIIFQNDTGMVKSKRKKRKNLLIQVSERSGENIVLDIENRFEFSKDKSDSLFLAKYYYDKNEYASSEKWALETNRLDNSIEESWLIFAKSLAKQGKRIESLRVLKAFSSQSGSVKAEKLMGKIRRGRKF